MFVIHKLFQFNKTSQEIKDQLKEIRAWNGNDIYYKIESVGEKLVEKCKSNKTQYLTQLIEKNLEHWQYLRDQVQEAFRHLLDHR